MTQAHHVLDDSDDSNDGDLRVIGTLPTAGDGALKTYTFIAAPLSTRVDPEAHASQGHRQYPHRRIPYDFEVRAYDSQGEPQPIVVSMVRVVKIDGTRSPPPSSAPAPASPSPALPLESAIPNDETTSVVITVAVVGTVALVAAVAASAKLARMRKSRRATIAVVARPTLTATDAQATAGLNSPSPRSQSRRLRPAQVGAHTCSLDQSELNLGGTWKLDCVNMERGSRYLCKAKKILKMHLSI